MQTLTNEPRPINQISKSSIGAAWMISPKLRRKAWNLVIWMGCIICGYVSGLLIASRYIITLVINCLPSI